MLFRIVLFNFSTKQQFKNTTYRTIIVFPSATGMLLSIIGKNPSMNDF